MEEKKKEKKTEKRRRKEKRKCVCVPEVGDGGFV